MSYPRPQSSLDRYAIVSQGDMADAMMKLGRLRETERPKQKNRLFG